MRCRRGVAGEWPSSRTQISSERAIPRLRLYQLRKRTLQAPQPRRRYVLRKDEEAVGEILRALGLR